MFRRRKRCAAWSCSKPRMRGKDPIDKTPREFCRLHTMMVEAWSGFHVSPWALKEPTRAYDGPLPPPPPPAPPTR